MKLSRHTIDANITQQDLIDSYLAPFQACVEQGKVSGLMCSCESRVTMRCMVHRVITRSCFNFLNRSLWTDNAINGKPTCADPWLLQDVARDAWGFDGSYTGKSDLSPSP